MDISKELDIEREKIDKINQDLVRLLDSRLEIVKKIAKLKQMNNMPIFQPDREEEIIAKVSKRSKNPEFTLEIFKKIMEESRKFQEETIQCQIKQR